MNRRSGIESRKKIIDAAMHVFSRQGFMKATIRDIAKYAGISIGGVYLYFKNKEELYKSLINERMHDIGAQIEVTTGRAESASEALSNFLKLYLDHALKHKEFILLHIREHGFVFGREEKRKFFKSQKKLIEQIILKGISNGEFRNCDAKKMSDVLMGSLRGIVLSIALDDDVHITPQMINEFIFQGLLTSSKEKALP
jgi:AcrR family transcriptional regulator